jgi:hypothetical protein
MPDLIYRMLSQVSSMRERIAQEVTAMQAQEITSTQADHMLVEVIRVRALPASWLPKVLQAWENPSHEKFRLQTTWSQLNTFTGIHKSLKSSPRRGRGSQADVAHSEGYLARLSGYPKQAIRSLGRPFHRMPAATELFGGNLDDGSDVSCSATNSRATSRHWL